MDAEGECNHAPSDHEKWLVYPGLSIVLLAFLTLITSSGAQEDRRQDDSVGQQHGQPDNDADDERDHARENADQPEKQPGKYPRQQRGDAHRRLADAQVGQRGAQGINEGSSTARFKTGVFVPVELGEEKQDKSEQAV